MVIKNVVSLKSRDGNKWSMSEKINTKNRLKTSIKNKNIQ